MKARIIDPWERKIEKQIESFYQKYDYTRTGKIKFEIVNDIYKRRLELLKNSSKEVEFTNQNKIKLKKFNGHVVWGYTPDDRITVLFNKNNLSKDDYTWLGTVHHEYIHAHDFLELFSTLNFEKNDRIYDDYAFYREFGFWTEFHARVYGSMNVYSNVYNAAISNKDFSYCKKLYEMNCEELVIATSAHNYYNIAQCLGRHAAMKTLFGSKIPMLQNACDEVGVLEEIVSLYDYLVSYPSFNEVDFNKLRALLERIESRINQN